MLYNLITNASFMTFIQTACQVIGLLGIFFLWLQIRKTDKWNKLQQSITIIWTSKFPDLKKEIVKYQEQYHFSLADDALTEEQLQKCYTDPNVNRAIIDFLNELEQIAGAFRLNAFNKQYTYEMWGATMCSYYIYFKGFIAKYRLEQKNEDLFSELEYLAAVCDKNEAREKIRKTNPFYRLLYLQKYKQQKLLDSYRKKYNGVKA